MQNNKRKRNVFMAISENEKGLTFISMLLTISIIVVTLPFLVYLFQYFQTTTYKEDISVLQFFSFLQKDALEAREVYSENNTLYFKLKNGDIAKVEMYSQLIRRQVSNQGHEIYLRDVASWNVEPLAYGSKITVTTLKGDTYEKTISHFNQ